MGKRDEVMGHDTEPGLPSSKLNIEIPKMVEMLDSALSTYTNPNGMESKATFKSLVKKFQFMQVTWKKGKLPRNGKEYFVFFEGFFYIMSHSALEPYHYYSAGDAMWEEHEVGEMYYSELPEEPKEEVNIASMEL